MRNDIFIALLCLVANALAQSDESFSNVEDSLLESLRSVTIYDSLSTTYPFELRERGTVFYSVENQTGTFSEAGAISRPLANVEAVYRIGTEDFLVPLVDPKTILGESEHIDETLKLHLDLNGDVYYAQYDAVPAKREPGTFVVRIDSMKAHPGPDVILTKPAAKSRTRSPEPSTGDGLTLEEEGEEVPEKTFIQKYWIYVIPLLLVLVLQGQGAEQ